MLELGEKFTREHWEASYSLPSRRAGRERKDDEFVRAPPMLEATRLICPAGAVAGTARSIMWAPIGAAPPMRWVMPMSARVTFTVRPGSESGAAQARRK